MASALYQGRQIVRAINLRLRYCEAAIEYYDMTIAAEEAKGLIKNTVLEKMKTLKVIEMQQYENYKALKQKLNNEVDLLFEDKTEEYRKIFKKIFLAGESIDDIAHETKRSTWYIKKVRDEIVKDCFEGSYWEE